MRSLLSLLSVFLLSLCITTVAPAQQALQDDPGYVDFQELDSWFDTQPRVEINIKGALLRLLAGASHEKNPELSETLDRLKAIQVRSFEFDDLESVRLEERVAELVHQLEGRGWESVVRIRDQEEQVDIFLHTGNADLIAGLTVLVQKPGAESVFVNIVGEIEPEQLGRVGSALDIPSLQHLSARRQVD